MNYYEHHLGDYARDTGHLSMMEHGAYRLLLDCYYSTGCGIPERKAHRWARARTKDERAAVDVVLEEFFELEDGLWINRRAQREIAQAQAKFDTARENGKKGGRPPKQAAAPGEPEQAPPDPAQEPNKPNQPTESKPTGFDLETKKEPGGFENETKTKAHQTPDTKHQTPDTSNQTHTQTDPVFPSTAQTQAKATAVCLALRAEGISSTNSAHPDLLALLEDRAEVQEFVSAARLAIERGKGFSYVLGVVKGMRADAKRMATSAAVRPTARGAPPQALSKQAALEQRNAEVARRFIEKQELAATATQGESDAQA